MVNLMSCMSYNYICLSLVRIVVSKVQVSWNLTRPGIRSCFWKLLFKRVTFLSSALRFLFKILHRIFCRQLAAPGISDMIWWDEAHPSTVSSIRTVSLTKGYSNSLHHLYICVKRRRNIVVWLLGCQIHSRAYCRLPVKGSQYSAGALPSQKHPENCI